MNNGGVYQGLVLLSACTIELQGWSTGDTDTTGHIRFNRKTLAQITSSNLAIAAISGIKKCNLLDVKKFDITQSVGANNFVSFIKNLPTGAIVFGASGGSIDGQEAVTQSTLQQLGLSFAFQGATSVTFYAMKDDPDYGFQRNVPGTRGPNQLQYDLQRPPKGKVFVL